MSTPILPLSVWLSGTNQNSIPANDNALRVEAMNREIISQAVTSQPASPTDGDTYIIAATHTGTQWATFNPKDIAIYRSGSWYAWAPVEGLVVNVAGSLYMYDGGVWASAGGGGGAVAGSDKQVQYNNAGSFGAEAGFEYDQSANTLSVPKVNESKGTDIASAATTDIGAATGNFVHVTGTTTITAFGTVAAGARRLVVFDGALTLTHNGTSLILPTGASITTAAGDTALCVSEGSGNWRVTSYQRKDGSALTASGGLTGFTSALNTASPNNTVNASSVIPSGGTTDQDGVYGAKGLGAIAAQVATNSVTGGNKRGTYAVDWQMIRGGASAAAVASGAFSVISGGRDNAASGAQSVVAGGEASFAIANYAAVLGGYNNTINSSATYASISGGSAGTITGASSYAHIGAGLSNTISAGFAAVICGGNTNSASANYSTVVGGRNNAASGVGSVIAGVYATDRGISYAFATGSGATVGQSQRANYLQYVTTTSATTTRLTADGAVPATGNVIIYPNNSVCAFRAMIVGTNTSTWDTAGFEIVGTFKRVANAASVTLVGTPIVRALGADAAASAWTAVAAVNTTLGSLEFAVTGAASTTIQWRCSVEAIERGG